MTESQFVCLSILTSISKFTNAFIGDLHPLRRDEKLPRENPEMETNVDMGYKVVSVPENEEKISGAKLCIAVSVDDSNNHKVSMEELFPISSGSILSKERRWPYEIISRLCGLHFKGALGFGYCKGSLTHQAVHT